MSYKILVPQLLLGWLRSVLSCTAHPTVTLFTPGIISDEVLRGMYPHVGFPEQLRMEVARARRVAQGFAQWVVRMYRGKGRRRLFGQPLKI